RSADASLLRDSAVLEADRCAVAVEVAQQKDLRAVVDGFAVDVQYQRGHRILGEGSLGWPAGPSEGGCAEPTDALSPAGVGLVQLGEGLACGAGVREVLIADDRGVEVVSRAHAEHADDEVRQSPGDRGNRRRQRFWPGEIH